MRTPVLTIAAQLASAAPTRSAVALAVGLAAPHVAVTPICSIQGSGWSSPNVGDVVAIEGVVTASFLDAAENGFFVQEPDCDGDAGTSDGIWIYAGAAFEAVAVAGQKVHVEGRVQEYYGLTEILLESLFVLGEASPPQPVTLEIPPDASGAAAYLEAREGMLVAQPSQRVVGATSAFGEAFTVPQDSGVKRVFREDDEGRLVGLKAPGRLLQLAHGDLVGGITGPLSFSYDRYKVLLSERGVEALRIEAIGLAPQPVPPAGPGELWVGTYNLENLFDPLDDPGKDDAEWTPDPATYAIEIARRARSIGDLLGAPDILGVQEVEKLSVLEDLVAHEALAEANYGAALLEGPDQRGIDVGLLYRRDTLSVVSTAQRQACTALDIDEPGVECRLPDGSTGNWLYSRPPLVVRLADRRSGAKIIVVVNHFKSKRGGDEATQTIRLAMAEHNLELLTELKASDPETPVLIVGDLNDFEDSPPLTRLTEDSWLVDPHSSIDRLADYTYVYNGVSQNLDYILLAQDVTWSEFLPAHVNVDYPAIETGEDDPASPRASDHDPLLIRLPFPQPGARPWLIYVPSAFRSNGVGEDRGVYELSRAPAGPAALPRPCSHRSYSRK